jgi:hypothetical protein
LAVTTQLSIPWKRLIPTTKPSIVAVDFHGDATPKRYLAESSTLLEKGNEGVGKLRTDDYHYHAVLYLTDMSTSKMGEPFCTRNIPSPKNHVSILPLKYVEEAKNATGHGLS